MARLKAGGQLPISAIMKLFRQLSRLRRYMADIGRNRCIRKGVGDFVCKFQGGMGSPTNNCWRQKTRVPGPSRGFVCVIARLVVLVQCRLVTDGQTDGRTDTR